MFEELDIVTLNHDIKKFGLKRGVSGTVVYVYKGGKVYEVEFMTEKGKTIAVLTLDFKDISPKPEIYLKSNKSDKTIQRSVIGDLPFTYYFYT